MSIKNKSFIEQLNDKFTEQELLVNNNNNIQKEENIMVEIIQKNNENTYNNISIDDFLNRKIENIVNNILSNKLSELNDNIDKIISAKLISHKHEIDLLVRESIKKIFNTV